MPVNSLEEGMEVKEGKDLVVNCKRTKFSVNHNRKNKVPDVLLHEVSAGKDPMNRLTESAVQITGEENSCTKGHAHGIFFTGNEPARSKLLKVCSASGWKEPLYDFEEQGPPHNKLFACKVTVHVEGTVNTVLECFSEPKRQKKAAEEHAAGGALWCLAHFGRVK